MLRLKVKPEPVCECGHARMSHHAFPVDKCAHNDCYCKRFREDTNFMIDNDIKAKAVEDIADWSNEEMDAEAKKVYAELAEAEAKMESELARDLALFPDVKFIDTMYVEYEGTLAERIKQFRDEMSWVTYEGIVGVDAVTGNRQTSDMGFDHEYVDQHCNGGMTGDDFSGYIYFPVGGPRYLKFYYAC